MQDSAVYVTREGLDKMKADLADRIDERRPEIADRLQKAIAMGDLKENADYHVAKEDQAFNEGRVKELQNAILSAVIITQPMNSNVVRLGVTVVIAEEGYEDEEETYQIVGAREADPVNGRISNESPIGRALMGAKAGSVVPANTPNGIMHFKVLKIS